MNTADVEVLLQPDPCRKGFRGFTVAGRAKKSQGHQSSLCHRMALKNVICGVKVGVLFANVFLLSSHIFHREAIFFFFFYNVCVGGNQEKDLKELENRKLPIAT